MKPINNQEDYLLRTRKNKLRGITLKQTRAKRMAKGTTKKINDKRITLIFICVAI